ncbi:DUF6473 family protein [Jannaschia aquimarina]|uniref:DUF6473 domain-containing protein n=1 Tax=Jannaschia aquimarina TaxID=935700 RepID=A0A0D1DDB8_9RHOB|nr:DUF6473 family protein [Jannaschia aquimarina]KIT17993.1 hypothetical protein jaqu_02200 [Jannaschia aquimarina]SNS88132.1 hypothetical protein SAMN05421775_103141 [Jannaschia aquimarina]
MTFHLIRHDLDYMPWEYHGSQQVFRGPSVDHRRPFVAVLGGSEMVGRHVRQPVPDLLAGALGVQVANVALHNAGPDAYLRDPALMDLVARADLVVLQVMGAANLSNRYYVVHPRRNDRFVRPTHDLRRLYPQVDFTDFAFTRHLLQVLRTRSPKGFQYVARELRRNWIARMTELVEAIGRPVFLVTVANRRGLSGEAEPLLIDEEMVDNLSPLVEGHEQCEVTSFLDENRLEEMIFSDEEIAAAQNLLPPLAHEEVAKRLVVRLRPLVARYVRQDVGGDLPIARNG